MSQDLLKVKFSNGNSKMGNILSVSLPPIVTCKNCSSCAKKCYAAKLCRIYPSVKNAYQNNLDVLNANRDLYFEQIRVNASMVRFFRYHVSGDIVDIDYLDKMCKVARSCKNTTFLAFTKNYDDINRYFENHRKPQNLKLIFSLPFDGAIIDNPHNLPTARVILKGCEPQKKDKICGGNCSECASCGIGCW